MRVGTRGGGRIVGHHQHPRDSAGDYTLAYLTAGWMAVAAGIVALALRRSRDSQPALATA